MSSAGYTRRKRPRYKASLALGAILFLASFALSLALMFYSSPRVSKVRDFDFKYSSEQNTISIVLGDQVGEKIYYSVNHTSSCGANLTMYFYNKEGFFIEKVELQSRSSSGVAILRESPYQVEAQFLGERGCRSYGRISFRFSSVDWNLHVSLTIAATVAGLLGMALVAMGFYSLIMEKEIERRLRNVKYIQHRASRQLTAFQY